MLRNICLIIVIMTMGHLEINAQKTAYRVRHTQIQKTLEMTDAQYKNYRDSVHWYDQQINGLLKNDSQKKAIASKEVADLMTKRRLYVQRTITPEQAAKLHEYNMRNRPESPRKKQQKELEARMKKKNIKMGKIPG